MDVTMDIENRAHPAAWYSPAKLFVSNCEPGTALL